MSEDASSASNRRLCRTQRDCLRWLQRSNPHRTRTMTKRWLSLRQPQKTMASTKRRRRPLKRATRDAWMVYGRWKIKVLRGINQIFSSARTLMRTENLVQVVWATWARIKNWTIAGRICSSLVRLEANLTQAQCRRVSDSQWAALSKIRILFASR